MDNLKLEEEHYNHILAQYASSVNKDKLNNIFADEKYDEIRKLHRTASNKMLYKENPGLLERMVIEYGLYDCFYATYKNLFEECIKRGCTTVYDIGSAEGAQANVITYENLPINYISIEASDITQMHNFEHIHKSYPFKINAPKKSIALSHLCIGLLYVSNSKEDKKMFEQLLQDFDGLILELDESKNTLLLQSIPNEKIDGFDNVYYFDCSKKKTLDGNLNILGK